MIKAIALDDEPIALQVIENYCSEIDSIELEKTFTKPNEALKYLHKFPIDLIFLDIQMPTMSGIDFYKSLDKNIMVVFTTAFSEYAVTGFELNAIDFLLKPFSLERFTQAVNKARDYYQYVNQSLNTVQNHMFLRADYQLVKINYADIIYIEGLNDYIKIHLHNHKPIVTRMTMKNILDRLPSNQFARVHRSYIVAISLIQSIKNKVLYISTEGSAPIEITIGKSFMDELDKIYKA